MSTLGYHAMLEAVRCSPARHQGQGQGARRQDREAPLDRQHREGRKGHCLRGQDALHKIQTDRVSALTRWRNDGTKRTFRD